MSEVHGPTASEQARADQIAAERRNTSKAQPSNTLRAGMQSTLSQPAPKKVQSAFDKVMEKVSEPVSTTVLPKEMSFDSHLTAVQEKDHSSQKSFVEEPHRDSEDKDSKVKDEGKKNENHSSTKGATSERVQAKSSLKQQSQGGGSEKQDQPSQRETKIKTEAVQDTESFQPKKLETVSAPVTPTVGWNSTVSAVGDIQAQEAPRTLSKALLDQIVQSVTILRRKDLDPEMTIQLSDSIYNGLKIKVTGKDDRVAIEFVAPNRVVEQTFRQERDQIAAALGEKGIEVRAMEVRLG